jgi:hypothetical protein
MKCSLCSLRPSDKVNCFSSPVTFITRFSLENFIKVGRDVSGTEVRVSWKQRLEIRQRFPFVLYKECLIIYQELNTYIRINCQNSVKALHPRVFPKPLRAT